MRIVIAGGSAAGIFAALLLARAGHEVVMLDRDGIEPASTVEGAAESAFRPSAPQIVQPHGFLPLCRELLEHRLPDIHGALLAAGMTIAPLSTQLPPTLRDHPERPGDDRLAMLLGRRSTFDWALRRAVLDEPKVSVRPGVRVTGFLATAGRPPRITGVQTSAGPLDGDIVIDATGRRSLIDRWLTAIDARQTSLRRDECGLAYYSRHFRVVSEPDRVVAATTRQVTPLPQLTAGIWGGDNGRMVLVVAPLAEDRRSRDLADPGVHTAALRAVPSLAAWLDKVEPTGGVYAMGGLANTLRRLVVDGAPVALGLLAVGDSVCTTNPTFGRGLALALSQAVDVVQALNEYDDDLLDLSLRIDRCITESVAPFYEDQAVNDQIRLAEMRHAVHGTPLPDQPSEPDRLTVSELRAASAHDPDLLRAFWQVFGMLRMPDEVLTDPALVMRARGVLQSVA
jgi:2-polyprenyl-6-methoxyphenol hydroxylase-like FAD-dependent oxidoreductase